MSSGIQPPRSERQIEQSLDVYAQLFQAANRDHIAAEGRSTAGPRTGRTPLPAPKAPVAPETLAQSGLSLMQVCDLILK
jgi:hypothetical protein